MVDKKKINKIKRRALIQKLQEYGFNEALCNALFLSLSANILNDPFLILSSFVYMTQTFKIMYDINKYEGEFSNNIVDYDALNSDEYLELKNKYKLFIKKLAESLKKIGFEDSMDLGIFLTIMLNEGVLSVPDYYHYKKDNVDNDIYFHETLGARVLSGYGVCRNAAALLRDVYKEMGYDAKYLIVRIHKYLPSQSHAVVLVSSDEGNYIIDPTWKTIGQVDDDYSKSKKIIDFDGDEVNSKYYFKGYYDDDNSYNYIDSDYFLNRENNREISGKDVFGKFFDMLMLFRKTYMFYDESEKSFREDNLNLIKDISNREQQLTLVKK